MHFLKTMTKKNLIKIAKFLITNVKMLVGEMKLVQNKCICCSFDDFKIKIEKNKNIINKLLLFSFRSPLTTTELS